MAGIAEADSGGVCMCGPSMRGQQSAALSPAALSPAALSPAAPSPAALSPAAGSRAARSRAAQWCLVTKVLACSVSAAACLIAMVVSARLCLGISLRAMRTNAVVRAAQLHACGHAPATKRLARSSSTRAGSRRSGRWKGGGRAHRRLAGL